MRYCRLGQAGVRVSELCLGTMTFDESAAWGASRATSRRILHAFLDAGGNFVDTHTYGPAEDYLGDALVGRRERVVLATKYGGTLDADDVNASGAHRKSLLRSVEASLRRLRTDYIDLLWLHAWDDLTPVAEVLRACDDLVRDGKVLYLGVANAPAWIVAQANTLAEWRGWTPFAAVQVEYSLIERDADREIVPMARSLGVAVTAWTPLASGWLTGKYAGEHAEGNGAPRRLDDPRMGRFLARTERNTAIAETVCAIAGEAECAPAHVALNWLRHRGAVPIFGARTVEQVHENVGCFDAQLTQDQLDRLTQASRIKLGFPHDFLASGIVRSLMRGRRAAAIDRGPGAGLGAPS